MRKLLVFAILAIFTVQMTVAQGTKAKLANVPPELCVVVVVAQPDCPLQLQNVRLFVSQDGRRPSLHYELINQSDRAVRFFSVVSRTVSDIIDWHGYGSGHESWIGQPDGNGPDLILPGDTYSNKQAGSFEVVPFNSQGEAWLTRTAGSNRLRGLWVVVIGKVVLEDGRVYENPASVDGISQVSIRTGK